MVEHSTLTAVKSYLSNLPGYGIHPRKGIVFGSFARGEEHEWSDIDLVVVAPEFDTSHAIELVKKLWLATRGADSRIEPVPCGEKEWESETGRPILEIARREGIVIAA